MAYPTVSATYGFRPVNLLGGQVYAGSTRQMAIASGHATNIFFGDVVIMSANGCITTPLCTDYWYGSCWYFHGLFLCEFVWANVFTVNTTPLPLVMLLMVRMLRLRMLQTILIW
jgi:hypothetical protein